MNKNIIAMLIAAAVTAGGCAAAASAQNVFWKSGAETSASTTAAMPIGKYFVDADGDGICDNRGTGFGGNGAGYVDADGDGVCDNLGTRPQDGTGRQNRGGRSR